MTAATETHPTRRLAAPVADQPAMRPLLIGVGGFLGAGKTATILRAAAALRDTGRRVAIITNDQASGLVDTAAARAALAGQDAPGAVVEIAGGCFCCRFEELAGALNALVRQVRPDVILAEAVGSCTDLAATVYQPIRQLGAAPVSLGPLTVVVDAPRLDAFVASGGLPGHAADVAYLFERQLAEADALLLNKCDLVTSAAVERLRGWLAARFPSIPVFAASAALGVGTDPLVRHLLAPHAGQRSGSHVLDLDYDRYAAAEAGMGWVNLEAAINGGSRSVDGAWISAVLDGIACRAHVAGAQAGHVKLYLESEAGAAGGSVVDVGQAPQVWQRGAPATEGRLILNARAATTPETLAAWVSQALTEARRTTGVAATVTSSQSLAPDRPNPPHRMAPARGDDLFRPTGRQASYSGAKLQSIAFPLGGIGTGTVSLGGRGNLQDWEIFNRPAKGRTLPYTFFALWAQPEGRASVARVLERQLLPPYTRDHGLPPHQAAGLPRLKEATFHGEYPFARIDFQDPVLPLEVSLEAFNPMVPLDADASGLPVGVFTWRLRNKGDAPVRATVAFSLCNAASYDGVASFGNRPQHPNFGGNVNAWCNDGDTRGLFLSRPPAAGQMPRPGDGSLAIATDWVETTFTERWERAGWFDSLQSFWDDFRADGRLRDRTAPEPSPDGLTDIGTLGLCATVPAGGEVALPFVLAWHFPDLVNYWNRNSPVQGGRLGNYYTTRHSDAWDVARDVVARLPNLRTRTLAFHQALYDSTMDADVIGAAGSQMSIIRTTTCLRTEDGAFHAFEGCNDDAGCCPMNCTHVWNYEQALAHLYPALERSMRETDFGPNTRDDGRMAFRTLLPLESGHLWNYKPAADGQMGCVLKLYREWLQCGDTDWLRRLWPAARRALEFAWAPGSWDADQDGVMEGEQHNTYDIEFFGPNTMCGTLYLGALRAASRMAEALGEPDFAARCQEVYEAGRQRYDAQLWTGEYYRQRVAVHEVMEDALSREDWHPSPIKPGESEPRYQYGPGCLSDQLLGQWFCHVVDLGYVLPEEHVRAALAAIVRHNWKPDLSAHESCQRTYALNDEAGLLLCSWPDCGRPAYPFPYADEVWTGIEYQVAAHCIYERLVDDGLAIVRGVSERHDGLRRNPWDQFECGHHYARALASWSVLLAASGISYSALDGRFSVAPRVWPRDGAPFKCFFSTATAWGTVRMDGRHVAIEVAEGELTLNALAVTHAPGQEPVSVPLPPQARVTPGAPLVRALDGGR